MKCEYAGCEISNGSDYRRNENERYAGWVDEPIFLCKQHSLNHTLLSDKINSMANDKKLFELTPVSEKPEVFGRNQRRRKLEYKSLGVGCII
jgi:hypothetical protein